MTVANTDILLGRGVLTWDRSERITDRYGTVYLIEEGHSSLTPSSSPSLIDPATKQWEGHEGTLFAIVTKTRKSTHIGDLFRGVSPRIPQVGQRIELGKGTLWTAPSTDGGIVVGLKPDDGREVDWLDIRALYDAHEQSVELVFQQRGRKHDADA